MDEIQGATIAGDILLGPVFGTGVAEDKRAQTVGCDRHAFDAVGRLNALHQGHFTQGFQYLRRLPSVQFLLALRFGQVVEQPIRAHRHGQVSKTMVAEGHHGSLLYSVKLAASAAKEPGVCFSKPA